MYEWDKSDVDDHSVIRAFVDKEIRPLRHEPEFGTLPPYDVLAQLWKAFGSDAMASDWSLRDGESQCELRQLNDRYLLRSARWLRKRDDFPPPTSFSASLGEAAWAGLCAPAEGVPSR